MQRTGENRTQIRNRPHRFKIYLPLRLLETMRAILLLLFLSGCAQKMGPLSDYEILQLEKDFETKVRFKPQVKKPIMSPPKSKIIVEPEVPFTSIEKKDEIKEIIELMERNRNGR